MNDKELQQEFIAFLQEKSGAKTEEELKTYVQKLGKEGIKEAYQEFTKKMTEKQNKKAKKALHGAKLNYIKSLKHICNEDEELIYFKKGGQIGCGCVKKQQLGGNSPEKKDSIYDYRTKKFRVTTSAEKKKQE